MQIAVGRSSSSAKAAAAVGLWQYRHQIRCSKGSSAASATRQLPATREGARVAYVRTVRTASGATAVQIVHSSRRGSRKVEHIGSAHTPEEVEALKSVAKERI